MRHLRKLHNRRQPPGLEWVILKRLPKYLLASTSIPLLMSALGRWLPIQGAAADITKYQTSIDIFAIAIGVTAWTAVFTVAIGCVIVVIMKGPAYVADAYELHDADQPSTHTHKGRDRRIHR